jgi:NAD(P)-dependent dehydrogenase (short-subunit alcohol dehydrogenase family)
MDWRKEMFEKDLFDRQVILITGAAGGIGRAAAERLRRCGATLSLTSLNAARLQGIAAELDAHAIAADLSRVDECKRVIDATLERFGRIDALVNCAGVWTQGDSDEATECDWDRCIDINLKGTFFLSSYAIPALKATRGAIINVGSDAGVVGNAGCAIYCASKGGVALMSKALALELAPFGVRVNALCPSDTNTAMLRRQATLFGANDPNDYLSSLLNHYPQRQEARFIEPDEVACFIVFLLSKAAAPITGAALMMDFGVTAGY